jgi:hypothetical protein
MEYKRELASRTTPRETVGLVILAGVQGTIPDHMRLACISERRKWAQIITPSMFTGHPFSEIQINIMIRPEPSAIPKIMRITRSKRYPPTLPVEIEVYWSHPLFKEASCQRAAKDLIQGAMNAIEKKYSIKFPTPE